MPDPPPPPFAAWAPGGSGGDVLICARELTCTVTASIAALHRYLRPPPRHIHLVLARAHACPTHLPDVPPRTLSCYAEAAVLPGLNVSELARRYEADPLVASNRRRRLRDPLRAGWFFQQFVKMAFPLFQPISTDYLIWDSDAVLIRPYAPVALGPGGSPVQRILTGGYTPMPQYASTYAVMMPAGRNALQHAPLDNTSLVTHHALVHTPWMAELTATLATHRTCRAASAAEAETCAAISRDLGWVWAALRASRGLKAFSEYAFYLSHVISNHAEQRVEFVGDRLSGWGLGNRTWCRNPLLADPSICPRAYETLFSYAAERALGVYFANFETHMRPAAGSSTRGRARRPVLAKLHGATTSSRRAHAATRSSAEDELAQILATESRHLAEAREQVEGRARRCTLGGCGPGEFVLKRPRECTPW